MREIKFRVWDGTSLRYSFDGFNSEMCVLTDLWTYFNESNYVVEQFTGLKDKNGKDCFEGDIIKVHEYKNELFFQSTRDDREIFSLDELMGEIKQTYIASVNWNFCGFEVDESETCSAGFGIFEGDQRHSSNIHIFEIIGNIHETPNLLDNAKP